MGVSRVRRPVAMGLVAALVAVAVGWSPAGRPQVVERPAAPSPVAEWTFDEATGTTATDSVDSLVGTLTGGTSWITSGAAQGDGALHFDGVDGAVTVPSSPALERAGILHPDLLGAESGPDQLLVSGDHAEELLRLRLRRLVSAEQGWQAVYANVLRTGAANDAGASTLTNVNLGQCMARDRDGGRSCGRNRRRLDRWAQDHGIVWHAIRPAIRRDRPDR